MIDILRKIAASRQKRVEEAKGRVPEAELRRLCEKIPPALDVLGRLASWPSGKRAVIAEVKRRSPSKGDIAPGIDAGVVAKGYERAGAFAISCLTEPDYFGGSLADLDSVRAAVKIPVLYKDFVTDPYQIHEARAHGADLALIIVALLGEDTKKYHDLMVGAGLTPLVEVHDEAELEIAVKSGARLIGVNNRNLKTFLIDLEEGKRLVSLIPKDRFAVAESGLKTVAEMDDFASAGAKTFLIGESIVAKPDPGAALRELVEKR